MKDENDLEGLHRERAEARKRAAQARVKQGKRWLVIVRVRGRTPDMGVTVFSPSPAAALTEGIEEVLSVTGATEHQGAWCYFYHHDYE